MCLVNSVSGWNQVLAVRHDGIKSLIEVKVEFQGKTAIVGCLGNLTRNAEHIPSNDSLFEPLYISRLIFGGTPGIPNLRSIIKPICPNRFRKFFVSRISPYYRDYRRISYRSGRLIIFDSVCGYL